MLSEVVMQYRNDVPVMSYLCDECLAQILNSDNWTVTVEEKNYEGACDNCSEEFYFGSFN